VNEAQLRAVLGEPSELVQKKIADRLNPLTRQFIDRSPFVVVATGRPDGGLDVSPRGDPAGFVRILDERTLLLPDRPGNKLADTLTNLVEDDRIALLFLIPGVNDTFRVNGRARIVDDPELLAASEVEGKVPQLGSSLRSRRPTPSVRRPSFARISGTPTGTPIAPSFRAPARSCARSPIPSSTSRTTRRLGPTGTAAARGSTRKRALRSAAPRRRAAAPRSAAARR
jgi:predicted pyridoxine 5'-phosphate oxidase superfamily flavin-nucleotide-binding protein